MENKLPLVESAAHRVHGCRSICL